MAPQIFSNLKPLIPLILLLSSVKPWREKGHLLTTYIAQEFLLQYSPETFDWCMELLKPLIDVCGEHDYPFIESSTYADKVKQQAWHAMYNHHFVSYRWLAAGSTYNYTGRPIVEHARMTSTDILDGHSLSTDYFNDTHANLTFAIDQLSRHLSSDRRDVYGSSKSLMMKSLSLRMLIHFIGDVHQPLHASERISDDHPDGDRGGNDYRIKTVNGTFALHYLWDCMMDTRDSNTSYPIDDIRRAADAIVQNNSFMSMSTLLSNTLDPTIWAMESHEIARLHVYRNIADDRYISDSRDICHRRIAMAAYRIAMTLMKLYRLVTRDAWIN